MEMFERVTRRYGKPEWNIDCTIVDGERVTVHTDIVWQRPFCNLIHFERALPHAAPPHPKVLIVAPMSGHYATLLRGTVEAFLLQARRLHHRLGRRPHGAGVARARFDLDDYIDYVISILHCLGGDTHVIAVCQPSVPVLAAVALMEARDDPYTPAR